MTIARQLGAGGEEVAAAVGRELGGRVLDGELLERAGQRADIPVRYLIDLDERGRSMWRRPADLVRLVPLPPINPDQPDVPGDRYPPTGPALTRGGGIISPAYWASEAYAALLAHTMQAEATDGDVVIIGRGGNEALAGFPGALHVLVTASDTLRVRRVMATAQIDAFDAYDRVRESDRSRAAYVRQFYGADWLNAVRYDLVVNRDQLSLQTATRLIATAASGAVAVTAPSQAQGEPSLLTSERVTAH